MNTAATTLDTPFPRQIRMTKAAHRTIPRPGYLQRFRNFIETSGWDEALLSQQTQVDRICRGVLLASVLILVPIVLQVLLR